MRWRNWLWGLCGTALCGGSAWAEQPALPPIVRTAAQEFRVPFAMEEEANTDLAQLLVSSNQGRSWHIADSAAPSVGEFKFRAPHDGEFWFAMRTVDRQGRLYPDAALEPEMRVVVQTVQRVSATTPVEPVQPTELPIAVGATPGISPRMLNSRTFEIDYEPPRSQHGSPREVVLWWTRDGGQTWRRHGADDDCRSPIRVMVEHDGLYGFTLVFVDEGGAKTPEPRDGDKPAAWVGVDTVPPSARLLGAELNGERDLIVQWDAADPRLAERPVSLWFRARGQVTWKALAQELPNSGKATCQSDERFPEQLHLRLIVRDEAGNTRVVDTVEPITPSVRLATRPGDVPDAPPHARWYQVLR